MSEPNITADRLPVSCVILTGNEELNIQRCLDNLRGHTDDILVVDSFSNDRTLDIVARYTDKVYQHRYEGHPQQWIWALANLRFTYDWIFAIDADFIVTPHLWRLLSRVIDDKSVNGFYIRHRQMFLGRYLHYGTTYPRYWMRLFRRDKVYVDPDDLVDVHFYVDGRAGFLEADVVEDNAKDRDLRLWVEKQVRFARSLAQEEIRRRASPLHSAVKPRLLGSPNERTLLYKQLWCRLPLYVRPFLLFLYRYVIRLGFLDGKEGLLYHFTQALLCRVLVDAWIQEISGQSVVTSSSADREEALLP